MQRHAEEPAKALRAPSKNLQETWPCKKIIFLIWLWILNWTPHLDCIWHPWGPCNLFLAKICCPRKKNGTSFMHRAPRVLGDNKGLSYGACTHGITIICYNRHISRTQTSNLSSIMCSILILFWPFYYRFVSFQMCEYINNTTFILVDF